MVMHMRKACRKRERQKGEIELLNNITYGGQHFPVFFFFCFFFISFDVYNSPGVKLVLMINIELTVSHLTDRT